MTTPPPKQLPLFDDDAKEQAELRLLRAVAEVVINADGIQFRPDLIPREEP